MTMKFTTAVKKICENPSIEICRSSWTFADERVGHDDKGWYYKVGEDDDGSVISSYTPSPEEIVAVDWKVYRT